MGFEFFSVGLIALLGALSPGPDFVVVAKSVLSSGRRAGWLTALGIFAGILVHSTYCVLGLALVIKQSVWLFDSIKYLGAVYLIYLGGKGLLAKSSHLELPAGQPALSAWQAFRMGFLTNLLNPKCTLFMLSIFTLVIKPGTAKWVQAILGLEIALLALLWFGFLSVTLTMPFMKSRLDLVQHLAAKATGLVLIVLALLVVFGLA